VGREIHGGSVMAFEFKKIGGKPKDKWKESLDKKYEKYKDSAEYIKDKITGKDKSKEEFLKEWESTLLTIPEKSIALAANALKIKNINSGKEVDQILQFLKEKGVVATEKGGGKKKPKNKFKIDIEESEQPDPVKKYKGPVAKKKYKKKIKEILEDLKGKKPNLAKQLKSLLGKIKDGKYKNLPKQFKNTLEDFNYTKGKKKLKEEKEEGLETSSTLMDTISGLEEMTAEAIQAEEESMELEAAQMKANQINRRIQDQQNKVEIRGISRDPGKSGTGFFKRKNQFKGVNV
tara:strand:+ start:41 stop:910 length:870 start_codon:yes stop_codon:yes gene_type:complete